MERVAADEHVRDSSQAPRRQYVDVFPPAGGGGVLEGRLAGKHLGQPRAGGDLQHPVHVGRAHVAVDEQDALLGRSGETGGQLDGDARLAFVVRRAGDGQNLGVLEFLGEDEERAEVVEALLIDEDALFLAAAQRGPRLDAPRQAGDFADDRQLGLFLDLLGMADPLDEPFPADGQAERREEAGDDAQQDRLPGVFGGRVEHRVGFLEQHDAFGRAHFGFNFQNSRGDQVVDLSRPLQVRAHELDIERFARRLLEGLHLPPVSFIEHLLGELQAFELRLHRGDLLLPLLDERLPVGGFDGRPQLLAVLGNPFFFGVDFAGQGQVIRVLLVAGQLRRIVAEAFLADRQSGLQRLDAGVLADRLFQIARGHADLLDRLFRERFGDRGDLRLEHLDLDLPLGSLLLEGGQRILHQLVGGRSPVQRVLDDRLLGQLADVLLQAGQFELPAALFFLQQVEHPLGAFHLFVAALRGIRVVDRVDDAGGVVAVGASERDGEQVRPADGADLDVLRQPGHGVFRLLNLGDAGDLGERDHRVEDERAADQLDLVGHEDAGIGPLGKRHVGLGRLDFQPRRGHVLRLERVDDQGGGRRGGEQADGDGQQPPLAQGVHHVPRRDEFRRFLVVAGLLAVPVEAGSRCVHHQMLSFFTSRSDVRMNRDRESAFREQSSVRLSGTRPPSRPGEKPAAARRRRN